MKHYLNVCDINGAEVAPVDVITFGSPCQDLSVAGKRAGLKHTDKGNEETTRSGLFMDAVRIIKEMRQNDRANGRSDEFCRPRFAVWENVTGAFSSNKGEDFRVVLEELCRVKEPSISIPRPKNGKWNNAGSIIGDGWSIAWRVLDAQYSGVPQRRKRIFLVADFGGQCSEKILFEQEGLRRDNSESKQERKSAAGTPSESTGLYDSQVYDARGNGDGNICSTLTGDHQNRITDYTNVVAKGPGAVCYADCVIDKENIEYIVRRLTPTECARLQGFPDRWGWIDHKDEFTDEEYSFWLNVRNTHAEINGKAVKDYSKDQMLKWYNGLHSDSSEYKMWGNGVALPCVRFVLKGIAEHGAKTLGSLFDGSGGFPLAGALNGIAPMWASEIEPYPIAVTMSRFKEKSL